MNHSLLLSIIPALVVAAAPAAAQHAPQSVLDELLAVERALSQAAAIRTPAEGIASLIAEDGVVFTRAGAVSGRTAALASLSENPANRGRHARWRSIRGGVSGDGRHGFTLGYLDIDGGDPATARRRYLAYWVRGGDGWRVAALKQVLRRPDESDAPPQPPVLPRRIVRPDENAVPDHGTTLRAAEQAFSDRAQQVGIRQAFQEYGNRDAIHMFGPTGFSIGLGAIGEAQADQTAPATINWTADTVIVASSGDLGLTIGHIRPNRAVAEGEPAAVPFFTIWRRDGPSEPWRYIAE